MPEITVNQAIADAIAEEMRLDPRVVMFGEGVATKRRELVAGIRAHPSPEYTAFRRHHRRNGRRRGRDGPPSDC